MLHDAPYATLMHTQVRATISGLLKVREQGNVLLGPRAPCAWDACDVYTPHMRAHHWYRVHTIHNCDVQHRVVSDGEAFSMVADAMYPLFDKKRVLQLSTTPHPAHILGRGRHEHVSTFCA